MIFRRISTLALVLALAACGGGGDDGPSAIDPGNPNDAMNNLLASVGSAPMALISGSPPAPSSSPSAPKADAGTAEVTITTSSASTASIPVSFQSQSAMDAIFAKVSGSSSYFEANDPVGGKVMIKAVPVSGNGQSFVLTLQLETDFQPGEFCLQISGRDSNNLVSNVVQVCTVLVPSIAQPAEDQPTAAELIAALDETWLSPCLPFQTPSASGSAKIGFTFDGSTYSQFIESWNTNNCPGNPATVGTVVTGSVQAGPDPVFLSNSGQWALPFDFLPDNASQQLGARSCFNTMRFTFGSGSNPDEFVLGLPVGFTVQGQADSAGSCVSAANRPTFLSDDIVFEPGGVLPVNQLPVANAGPNQSVNTGAAVQLNGNASTDADGTITSFAWTQTAGPAVTLNNASTATPSFTAPNSSATLTFRLTVTDNSGGTAQDTVDVVVSSNQPPVADAGPDFAKPSASEVTLDGTGSSDPDGTIVTYAWTQTAGAPVSLEDANTATPTFTAPVILNGSTPLTFQLTVFDNNSASDTDTVVVTIAKTVAPVADAGPDQSVKTGALVTLDGTGSSDPDEGDSIASFAWTQTGGAAVTLNGASTASPTFTAPFVEGGSIALTFQLTVTDEGGATDTDTIVVTVNAKQPPVANAGPNFGALPEEEDVQLDGSDSTDPDGTIASYSWTQLAGPGVTLVNANTATPTFDMTSAPNSTYTFRLTVTDNDGLVDTDDVVVTATAPLDVNYSAPGFVLDATEFSFVISANQAIGNWFVDQSNASRDPESEIFSDVIDGNGRCTGGPQGIAEITCDADFVTEYLGGGINGCETDSDSNAVLSANARVLTFNVVCAPASGVGSSTELGIGRNGGSQPNNTEARSAATGDTEAITGFCTLGQGCTN